MLNIVFIVFLLTEGNEAKNLFQPNNFCQQELYIIEVGIVEIGCKIEDRFTDIIKSQ